MRILIADSNLRHLEAAREQLSDHEVIVFNNCREAAAFIRDNAGTPLAIDAIGADPWIKLESDSDNNAPVGIMLAGIAYRRGVRRIVLYTAGQLMGIDRGMNGMIIAREIGDDKEAYAAVNHVEHLPYPGGGYYANVGGSYDPERVALKDWAQAFAHFDSRRAA